MTLAEVIPERFQCLDDSGTLCSRFETPKAPLKGLFRFEGQRRPVDDARFKPDRQVQTLMTPSLAGQPKLFIENQLVLIQEGLREILQMKGLLDKVTDPRDRSAGRLFFSPGTG